MKKNRFEIVIGLEVHVQLKTRTKLFCGCASEFGREPNTLTCPVCTGQPGVLPVLNREALTAAVKAGLSLKGRIAPVTKFDRKNYFYPDLPKGYQVSQFDMPVAEGGFVEIRLPDDTRKRIGITRAHLEEDAGKAVHPEGADISMVDLNRAGVPLLEIVTEPEIASPAEAHAFLVELKRIMQYLDVSDCDMEKGSLRCDANISLRPAEGAGLGVKTEIKNLNSFHNVEQALAFEAKRQEEILSAGEGVIHETRMWREEEERTCSMRSKEEAHDYRYFPEPDLPPFHIAEEDIEDLKNSLPELPLKRADRFRLEYGLSDYDVGVLTTQRDMADFFEACVKACGAAKEASNWIQSVVMKETKERGMRFRDLRLSPEGVAALITLVKEGRISHQAAKRVVPELIEKGGDPLELVKEMGLEQVSDLDVMEKIVSEVLERCAEMAEDFRNGKEKALNALVGQVMRASKGKANPALARELLIKKIKGGRD